MIPQQNHYNGHIIIDGRVVLHLLYCVYTSILQCCQVKLANSPIAAVYYMLLYTHIPHPKQCSDECSSKFQVEPFRDIIIIIILMSLSNHFAIVIQDHTKGSEEDNTQECSLEQCRQGT